MNELQIFRNNEFGEMRVVEVNNEPWFVAIDACNILELSNPTVVISRLDEDEVTKFNLGRQGETNLVNEYGLYNLILGSRKPEAKKFKRWVTHEVLPSIRKHGAYMTPQKLEEVLLNPDILIKLATNLKMEQEKRILAEKQLERDKPKVLFAEAWEVSETSILVGEMAKLLAKNGIEDMGQNRFFKWLRSKGFLHKNGEQYNLPSQRAIELEIIEVKTTTIINPDGSTRVTKTPKVTVKGQMYFIGKFKEKEIA